MKLLSELLARGFSFNTNGTILVVAPAHAVTPKLLAVMTAHKPALWSAVRAAEVQADELITRLTRSRAAGKNQTQTPR